MPDIVEDKAKLLEDNRVNLEKQQQQILLEGFMAEPAYYLSKRRYFVDGYVKSD